MDECLEYSVPSSVRHPHVVGMIGTPFRRVSRSRPRTRQRVAGISESDTTADVARSDSVSRRGQLSRYQAAVAKGYVRALSGMSPATAWPRTGES
jgi:hypothetical protein